jgi:hypothetical protein
MTEESSKSGLEEVKINKLKKWKEDEYRKILSDLQLILEGQKINGLAKQNSELLDFNKELKIK